MVSRNLVFWEVDAQADFMLPGGKLYVPGAEKLLPNIRRLTDAARRGAFFWSRMAAITRRDDPEFAIFPAALCQRHARRQSGSRGSDRAGRHRPERCRRLALPDDLSRYQQILLEKQTLDIFESRSCR